MSVEAATPVGARQRRRKTTMDRVRDAMAPLHDHRGQVLSHTETGWASITFAGARHTLSVLFLGEEAVTAGEALVAALPDHEFAIPGQLVADATVTTVEHQLLPHPRMLVECELLLLEDA